jgi:hypothetical protein
MLNISMGVDEAVELCRAYEAAEREASAMKTAQPAPMAVA